MLKKIIIFFIVCLFCFGVNIVYAQRVGRMGVLIVDPNGRDQFVQSINFQNTSISIGDSADVTIDLSVSSGWTQDTSNKYIYTTDGDYLVGINDATPNAQLDIDISGAAVVGLDIDGAVAQSANFVDIDDATGDSVFIIDSSGNVGIGTTGPDRKLHINTTINNIPTTLFQKSGTATALNTNSPRGPLILLNSADTINNYNVIDFQQGSSKYTVGRIGTVATTHSETRNLNRADMIFYLRSTIADELQEVMRIKSGGNVGIGTTSPSVPLEVDGVIRSTLSEWYACEYVTVYSADPGGSGAVRVTPSSDTLGGWNLDADGETLEFSFHICSDWDATSDVYIRIEYEVDDATATGNAVFDATVYIKGEGDYVTKSQSLTFTQDVSGDDQYTLRYNDLTIDYDDVTDGLSVNDHLAVVLNFDATSSDITDVIFVGGTMRYQTNKLRVEIP